MSYFGPFAILVRDIVLYKSKGTGGGVVTTTPGAGPTDGILLEGAGTNYLLAENDNYLVQE